MTSAITRLSDRRKAAERARYAALVLDAWDAQNPNEKLTRRVGKPALLDTNPDVRRKAKSQL